MSATSEGDSLTIQDFSENIINKLQKANVKKVTLTGGEPFVNEDLYRIVKLLFDYGIGVCICTNATSVTEDFLESVKNLNVHFNVSLDGMSAASHGRFRGNECQKAFTNILENIKSIGKYNMLNGILTTPNALASVKDYIAICDYAIECGAEYYLMNPLSPLGRGANAKDFVLDSEKLREIKRELNKHIDARDKPEYFNIVYIRFPDDTKHEPSSCPAGSIPYMFTNGDIAICPYMAFAAQNDDNEYNYKDFIIGNMFDEIDIQEKIITYKQKHKFCQCGLKENAGCPAMKISKGLKFTEDDIL
jgi:MoaA/NifB/PqqE/SkfB family radical SAM enzyme